MEKEKKKTTKTNTKSSSKTTKKVVKVEEPKKVKEEKKEIVENPIKNTMSDKTRYIIVAIISVLFLGLIIGLAVFGNKEEKTNTTGNSDNIEIKTGSDRKMDTEFLKEFYATVDSKDKEIIFFASATCGYCNLQKPIFQNIIKDYNLKYFDIDVTTISEAESNEVVDALKLSGATPTTIIVQNGKIVKTNEGYMDGKAFVEFLVETGVLTNGSTYKEEAQLKEINYSDFTKIVEKKGTTAVLIDTTACQDCIDVRSTISSIAEKHNFTVSYMSASYLSQEDINNFVENDLEKIGYDEKSYKSDKTVNVPLLLIIKDGKVKKYALGVKSKSDYEKIFKEYKLYK